MRQEQIQSVHNFMCTVKFYNAYVSNTDGLLPHKYNNGTSIFFYYIF